MHSMFNLPVERERLQTLFTMFAFIEKGLSFEETMELYDIGEAPHEKWGNLSTGAMVLRDTFISKYGFVIPVKEMLDALAEFVGERQVLEVGSGSGYIASRLQARGVNIQCTDLFPVDTGTNQYYLKESYMSVEQLAASDAMKKYPAAIVLLTWPSMSDPFGAEVVDALQPGQTLIYNGEGCGGCCASDEFFRKLDKLVHQDDVSHALNEHHAQWHGIHDHWMVFSKARRMPVSKPRKKREA